MEHNHNNTKKVNLLYKLTYHLRSYTIDYLSLSDYIKVFSYNTQSQQDMIRYFRFKGKGADNNNNKDKNNSSIRILLSYLKYFHLFNTECKAYYFKLIHPLLLNADGVYDLLTTDSYPNFLSKMKTAIDIEKTQYNLTFNWDIKEYTTWYNRLMIINILFYMNAQVIIELDYSNITPTKEGITLLRLIIKNLSALEYLDISNSQISNESLIDIIKETGDRVGNFTLSLLQNRLSKLHLRMIHDIMDNDTQKKFIIDSLYNEIIRQIKEEHSTK